MFARRIAPAACSALLGLLLVPATASAAGFTVARFGSEHGHPTTDNATAIYYNPAALTNSEGTHLFLDGSLAWRSLSYTRPNPDVDTPESRATNTGEATMFNFLAGPMAAVSTRLDDLALAGGFYVPFGGRTSWDQNDAFANNNQFPGARDGVQRWWDIESELVALYLTAAAAYEFGDSGFSVGLNLSLIRTNVNTVRARNNPPTDDPTTEGRSLLTVDGFQYGFGLGVQYEAIKNKLWLGASYTSQPNPFAGGEMRLEGTLKNKFGAAPETEQNAALIQELPDIIRLGGRYRASKELELRLHGDYQRWSVFDKQCVVQEGKECTTDAQGQAPPGDVLQNQIRRWDDTWGVRAGVGYWTNESLELFAGAGYNSNAVPDETMDPSLPDFESITATLGLRIGVTNTIKLAASYTQFFWISREITNSRLAAFTTPNNAPSANGTYSQSLGAFNVNADFQF